MYPRGLKKDQSLLESLAHTRKSQASLKRTPNMSDKVSLRPRNESATPVVRFVGLLLLVLTFLPFVFTLPYYVNMILQVRPCCMFERLVLGQRSCLYVQTEMAFAPSDLQGSLLHGLRRVFRVGSRLIILARSEEKELSQKSTYQFRMLFRCLQQFEHQGKFDEIWFFAPWGSTKK